MFKELAPLLSKRSLIFTVTSVGDERIRVTITPRPTGKDDVKQLSQPFAVEGTAEELDTELPAAIVTYTAAHMTLENSIAQVKTDMEATLKEVKDEAAKKVAEAKKTNKVGNKTPTTPVKAVAEVKKAPEPPSLFDTSAPATETPAVPAAAPAPIAATTPEPDQAEDEDEEEEDQDDSETPEAASGIAASGNSDEPLSMFASQSDEEAEILREAFPTDGEPQAIAA